MEFVTLVVLDLVLLWAVLRLTSKLQVVNPQAVVQTSGPVESVSLLEPVVITHLPCAAHDAINPTYHGKPAEVD